MCHPECKDNLPLPCISAPPTPGTGKVQGVGPLVLSVTVTLLISDSSTLNVQSLSTALNILILVTNKI